MWSHVGLRRFSLVCVRPSTLVSGFFVYELVSMPSLGRLSSTCLVRCLVRTSSFGRSFSSLASTSTSKDTTRDAEEIHRFRNVADVWWNSSGPFRVLRKFHPLRMEFILQSIYASNCASHSDTVLHPLAGLRILDLGCGGGFLSESLARLGAHVVGVDVVEESLSVARAHLQFAPSSLASRIEYRCTSAEKLAMSERESFDVVCALDVIEHVANVKLFLQSAVSMAKPNAPMIFSTLNRTPSSFLLGIYVAEYLLNWVPRGTHDWKKFLRPDELSRLIEESGASPFHVCGARLVNPLMQEFRFHPTDTRINYFLAARKHPSPMS